jgi:hypothetical protein
MRRLPRSSTDPDDLSDALGVALAPLEELAGTPAQPVAELVAHPSPNITRHNRDPDLPYRPPEAPIEREGVAARMRAVPGRWQNLVWLGRFRVV